MRKVSKMKFIENTHKIIILFYSFKIGREPIFWAENGNQVDEITKFRIF